MSWFAKVAEDMIDKASVPDLPATEQSAARRQAKCLAGSLILCQPVDPRDLLTVSA